MAIVTISRQMGSLGDEIARRLAKRLGVDAADREILDGRLRDRGISERNLDRYDEKRPGFWESFSSDKDRYLHSLKTAILDYARDGNGVVVGRGAPLIFHDVPGILNLRFVAPMESRIPRIADAFNCSPHHAEKLATQSDHDRSGFYRFFFHCSWSDRDLYDAIVNTGRLTPDTVVELILATLASSEVKERSAGTVKRLEERSQEERIIEEIRYTNEIPVRFLTVRVSGTAVVLGGSVNVPENAHRCEEIALSVKGVGTVQNEIAFIPEYYGPVM